VVNETHTNSYAGPRLLVVVNKAESKNQVKNSVFFMHVVYTIRLVDYSLIDNSASLANSFVK
jgi:hypothetical protein